MHATTPSFIMFDRCKHVSLDTRKRWYNRLRVRIGNSLGMWLVWTIDLDGATRLRRVQRCSQCGELWTTAILSTTRVTLSSDGTVPDGVYVRKWVWA